ALSHATGELVRVLFGSLVRRGNAGEREGLDGEVPRLPPAEPGVDARHLRHLIADGEDGIERRHRLLKNHRYAIAADAAHLVRIDSGQSFSLELHHPAT